MSDLAREILVVSLPYLLILSFLILAPYAMGLGLWKLGLKNNKLLFKDLYQGIQLVIAALYMIFLIVRVSLWSWQW